MKKLDVYLFPMMPVPKPRMTQRDRWKKRPIVTRYHTFKDEINDYARSQKFNWVKGQWISLLFTLPMPKSWTKKKKELMNGELHESKPDLDNLIKAVLDALFDEDKEVARFYMCEKRWGTEPTITLEIYD